MQPVLGGREDAGLMLAVERHDGGCRFRSGSGGLWGVAVTGRGRCRGCEEKAGPGEDTTSGKCPTAERIGPDPVGGPPGHGDAVDDRWVAGEEEW